MPIVRKTAIAAAFCSMALLLAHAQDAPEKPVNHASHRSTQRRHTLSSEDRTAVLNTALDWKEIHHSGRDCSHLVHDIYSEAGFPYTYADSEDLYAGAPGFLRVSRPQAGDVIVWHGHAGIVVRPSRHTFFSFLSSRGPGIDDYKSPYWRGRGQPRFYRYVKTDSCAGCTLARRSDY